MNDPLETAAGVPVMPDSGQPMSTVPPGFLDRRDLLEPAQYVALSEDYRRQRFALGDDVLKFAIINPKDPREREWVFDHKEILAHDLYRDCWPIIESNLVEKHTRGVKGKENKIVRTVAVCEELPRSLFIKMVGRNTPFLRLLFTMSTNHGRVFTYDPERPTDTTKVDCKRERYLGVLGGQPKERGFSGEFRFNFEERRWQPVIDPIERHAIAGAGESQLQGIYPTMYKAEHFDTGGGSR